jgi:hypothetical protein
MTRACVTLTRRAFRVDGPSHEVSSWAHHGQRPQHWASLARPSRWTGHPSSMVAASIMRDGPGHHPSSRSLARDSSDPLPEHRAHHGRSRIREARRCRLQREFRSPLRDSRDHPRSSAGPSACLARPSTVIRAPLRLTCPPLRLHSQRGVAGRHARPAETPTPAPHPWRARPDGRGVVVGGRQRQLLGAANAVPVLRTSRRSLSGL